MSKNSNTVITKPVPATDRLPIPSANSISAQDINQEIHITKIKKVSNIRETFDENFITDIARSIIEHGIITRVTVSPVEKEGVIQYYRLVAGEQRCRGVKEAVKILNEMATAEGTSEETKKRYLDRATEIKTIPCVVRNLTKEQILEIQYIENGMRQDVHAYEEAKAFRYMLDNGYDLKRISDRTGKRMSFIAERLQLLQLITDLVEPFRRNMLPIGHAKEICRLSADDQQKIYNASMERVETEDEKGKKSSRWIVKWTGETLRKWIRDNCMLDLSKAAFDKTCKELHKAAGACATCPKRSGFNVNLFADMAGGVDTCFDASCFQVKLKNHLDKNGISLKNKHGQFLRLSNETKLAPGHHDYNKVSLVNDPDTCGDPVPAMLMTGPTAGRTEWICQKNFECGPGCPRYKAPKTEQEDGGETDQQGPLHKLITPEGDSTESHVDTSFPPPPAAEDLELPVIEGKTGLPIGQPPPLPPGAPAAPAPARTPATKTPKQTAAPAPPKPDPLAGARNEFTRQLMANDKPLRNLYANRIFKSELAITDLELRIFARSMYAGAANEVVLKVHKLFKWNQTAPLSWEEKEKAFSILNEEQCLMVVRMCLAGKHTNSEEKTDLAELIALGKEFDLDEAALVEELFQKSLANPPAPAATKPVPVATTPVPEPQADEPNPDNSSEVSQEESLDLEMEQE